MLSEEEWDQVHDLESAICVEVAKVVSKRLAGCSEEVEDVVRTRLTEGFRFWKGLYPGDDE